MMGYGLYPLTPGVRFLPLAFILVKKVIKMEYKNTRSIGNIGESVALSEFVKHDIPTFMPFGQNTPVDLIVYINNKFHKIQVKTSKKIVNGKISFDVCRTNGFTLERIPYKEDEVDYFFLYCIENNESYLIDYKQVNTKTEFTLRVEKTKNNQVKNINMAKDFIFEEKIKEILNR